MTTQDVGETINATNIVEGISPCWNEMIYAEISEDTKHSEGKTKKRKELNIRLCRNYSYCY